MTLYGLSIFCNITYMRLERNAFGTPGLAVITLGVG